MSTRDIWLGATLGAVLLLGACASRAARDAPLGDVSSGEPPASVAEPVHPDDGAITRMVQGRLMEKGDADGMQVKVETRDGVVLLSGYVDTARQQSRAADIARGVPGVRSVRNACEVRPSAL